MIFLNTFTVSTARLMIDSGIPCYKNRFTTRRIICALVVVHPTFKLRGPRLAELRTACGNNPKPVNLVVLDSLNGHKLEDWVTIHFDLNQELAKQEPFLKYGTSVTQRDLPDIVSAIRDQNEEEFGEGADRPY